MGLQWRQADVSMSISRCGFGREGSALSVSACFYYLAKTLRSIVGHKECVEGSIVRLARKVGAGLGASVLINGEHYLTNWSCFQEGTFLTSLRSERRRIINRNFPMLSIRLFLLLDSGRASHALVRITLLNVDLKTKQPPSDTHNHFSAFFFFLSWLPLLFERWLVVLGDGLTSDAQLQEESITLNLRLWVVLICL